ncbi:uncharacterized protein PHALS_15214 [Plasmopara halstedii]|uniref:Uncharacterized protein n=1 Tax=Plasmopara halstedii TaxID=4781 RepID=A0A0P1B4G7_PLAHL|nr:uncharacterized protein PHALS_15214 [Plasmopara halstedii]CEG49397.1 hypothetical protein PHALS_15214 [Plasmopara halstedii]|eukprot:XP_024585766.1 hypothetical protein PHALS_15214 [Plasmopara halstedii]
MGQVCSNAMAFCCLSRRHYYPESKENKEPHVVEDESWKRWSSYNLIHHSNVYRLQGFEKYTPPTYKSLSQQPAEAVWEV